ncbi:hypothetical protein [Vallitalea sp.]|jgi:hypothetical protein|uniref:hypothetical protein n=1 Tax=Vallitalea sp. TaxID=1882829 RepID=UPI0025D7A27F|nr:hypothetical protein [Vallitalea sp.]MCT4686082.1 hypothetical protein [Vallitalea sp.]
MANKEVKKYSIEQILRSNQFSLKEKYLLTAILENKEYTIDEVKSLLEKEMKRGVK